MGSARKFDNPGICTQHPIQPELSAPMSTGATLDLHVNETTISFPFAEAQARDVSTAINGLLQTFAAKQAAERPKRWQAMEYRYKGTLLNLKEPHAKCGSCLELVMLCSCTHQASAATSARHAWAGEDATSLHHRLMALSPAMFRPEPHLGFTISLPLLAVYKTHLLHNGDQRQIPLCSTLGANEMPHSFSTKRVLQSSPLRHRKRWRVRRRGGG